VVQPAQNFGGLKCLILGEQQYFVWNTASQGRAQEFLMGGLKF